MTWITVYSDSSWVTRNDTEHFINVDHIVQVVRTESGDTDVVLSTGMRIQVTGTPSTNNSEDAHQDIIDQIKGEA
jgi:hypothetical protein